MSKNNLDLKISLAKARIYRFNNKLDNHVLIEEIENNFINHNCISCESVKFISNFLKATKIGKNYEIQTYEIAKSENIDVKKHLKFRLAYEKAHSELPDLKKLFFIIGSPRSGTSLLYNLLAYHDEFSYFNSSSHFKWSLYNLNHNGKKRKFIDRLGKYIFQFDTKKLKLNTKLILPSESEDIFNRSIEVYRHIKSHQYLMHKPRIVNPKLLEDNIKKHNLFFKKKNFLCKSPFNSFRIRALNKSYDNCYFIHISRNGYLTSDSIRENKFKYFSKSLKTDNPKRFWEMHIQAIFDEIKSHGIKIYQIKYEELISNPQFELTKLFEWMEVSISPLKIDLSAYKSKRASVNGYPRSRIVDKYNKLLGY